jgi:hypothetical protein
MVRIAKSHEGDPSNQKAKIHQLAEAGPTESMQEGDSDIFSMIMAHFHQPGRCCIHLTSNPGVTSTPQKELLHYNGLHHNATSLL